MKRLLALLVLSACDAGSVLLYVDVRSDLAPGLELTRIVTTADTDPELIATYDVSSVDDFVNGERVAELEIERRGTLRLRVAAYDGDTLAVARSVLVELDSSRVVTVLITRDCRGVGCDEGEACWAGRCVEETCTERCDPECDSDADCAPIASCTDARCDEGACVYPIRAGACAAPAVCNPDVGCEGCGAGELYCGACVDPETDDANCGTCGAICTAPQTCWEGACGFEELLYWINDRRSVPRMCGAMPMPAVDEMTWDDRIAMANQRHADDMAAQDLMMGFYTGTDGSTPQSRLTPLYSFAWEYQQTFASLPSELLQDIVDQMLTESTAICGYLMAPQPIHLGAGAAVGASGSHYWAFQLARPN